jgi:hypothetical protein
MALVTASWAHICPHLGCLRCRVEFVLALWWQCLGVFMLAFSRQPLDFALTLVWVPLQHRVEFALALWCKRLGFAPALVRWCLELLLALLQW